jgi:hypothetical protein
MEMQKSYLLKLFQELWGAVKESKYIRYDIFDTL